MVDIQNSINHMIPELYDTLVLVGPTIEKDCFKMLLIHIERPATAAVNIPIKIYSTHSDHYLEVVLTHEASKKSAKIILDTPWRDSTTMLERTTEFLNAVIGFELLTPRLYAMDEYRAMPQTAVIRACVCPYNYAVAVKPVLGDNITRLVTWSLDKTVVKSSCLACDRYNRFTKM